MLSSRGAVAPVVKIRQTEKARAEPSRRGDIIRALHKALRLSIDTPALGLVPTSEGPHSHIACELPRSITPFLLWLFSCFVFLGLDGNLWGATILNASK